MLNKINDLDFPVLEGTTIFYRCENNKTWDTISTCGASEDILGCASTEIKNNQLSIGRLITENEKEVVWNAVQEAIQNKRPFHLTYHIQTPSNQIKTLFEQGQGIYSGEKLIELCGFITDITHFSNVVTEKTLQNHLELLASELAEAAKNEYGYVSQRLSSREIEIIIGVCKGMTMKEIGLRYAISPRTVEMHINRIRFKLNCANKIALKKLFFKTSSGRQLLAWI